MSPEIKASPSRAICSWTPELLAGSGPLLAALEAARREDPSRLLRLQLPLAPDADLLGALSALPEALDATLWLDPELELLGLGEVARAQGAGPSRWETLRAARGELASRLRALSWDGDSLADAPLRGPLGTISSSFADQPPASTWAGWPAAELCIPEALLWVEAGQAWLNLYWDAQASDAPLALPAWAPALAQALAAAPPRGEPFEAGEGESLESWESWRDRILALTEALRTRTEGGAARDAEALAKVVFARAIADAAPAGRRFDACATAAALRALHPTATTFLWRRQLDDAPVAFVGATPETLGRVRGDALETHALAGTAARAGEPAEDARRAAALLASAKDRAEQAFVTEELRRRLGPMVAELEVGAPRVRELATLLHLETPILGRFEAGQGDILRVAEALHPTPAVGGLPSAAAQRWIAEVELLERGPYAAPLGWFDAHGGGSLAVALRCARLAGGAALSFAGAGIVAASEPQAEWDETRAKAASLRRALRLEESR